MIRSLINHVSFHFINFIFVFFLLLFTSSCEYFPQLEEIFIGAEEKGKTIVQTEWSEKNLEKPKKEVVVDLEKPKKEVVGLKKPKKKVVVDLENKKTEIVIASKQIPETVKQKQTDKKRASGYTIQVGAFSVEKNASKFVETLKNEGRQAYILENPKAINQTVKTVAFGNFDSKTKAIKEARRFTDEKKMESVVVFNYMIQEIIRPKTQPKSRQKLLSAPERIKKTSKKTGRYTFQIGGLFTKKNANHLLKRLQKKGYIPFIKKQLNEEQNETWYKVQIGFYDTIDTAAIAAEDFSIFEKIPAMATQ